MNKDQLKDFQTRYGLTNAAIGRLCDKDPNTIGRYLSGTITTIPDHVTTILTAYAAAHQLVELAKPSKTLRHPARSSARAVFNSKKGNSNA